jgi:rubrerythrin
MNVIAELVVSSLKELQIASVPHYTDALVAAFDRWPPPYSRKGYGEIFRQVASDPCWLAESLVDNAWREGDGAGRLWSLAACTADEAVAAQVKQHALDESRHARWYVAMLQIVFPNAVEADQKAVIDSLSPGYTHQTPLVPVEGSPFAHSTTVDDLIQMNIAEIRTCVHHLLQRPMLLAHCDPRQRSRLVPILESLLHDEKKHVGYTAQLIEEHARKGGADEVRALMSERVFDFNEITTKEVDQRIFEST